MNGKKTFFANYAKSSAALISLGIHAVLIVVALSFVAVTVIQKEDPVFEAKPVNRPKMKLKKLQVPVNIKKKKTQKPKLRKRIVVQPKMNQTMPDIKMPEITGIKGGLGSGSGGSLGGGGGLGFTMPEIDIFGIKGKGEKVFLILDTSNHMLVDELGGIPAYTIIKEELIRIVESLPATALINVAVYQGNQVQTAFPQMEPASTSNADKIKVWLEPLNSSANAARSGRNYGIRTLGPGGSDQQEDLRIGVFSQPVEEGGKVYGGSDWFSAVMVAHKQQADTIFLLTNTWGSQGVAITTSTNGEKWSETSAGKKWAEKLEKAKKLFVEENKKRKENGEPPKVLTGGRAGLVNEYFPGTPQAPRPEYYNFQPKEFAEAFLLTRDKYKNQNVQVARRLGKRLDFSFNVVRFVAKDHKSGRAADHFQKLTGLCKGEYQTVSGLEEIQGYVSANPEL